MKLSLLLLSLLLALPTFAADKKTNEVMRKSMRNLPLDKIKLPPGFTIKLFADQVTGAREMTWGTNGTLFVGTITQDHIWAIRKDGKIFSIGQGLHKPNGVAVKDSSLYVAEENRILRYDNIESNLEKAPEPKVVREYPESHAHEWKFIAFGPDEKLYVPVGAPCNICEVKDPFATITRINSDGAAYQVFARGIRNTVGFDWSPESHDLWFTDNGRDNLGDNVPPDELNKAQHEGLHFGFPFCHGGNILDPEFGKGKKCEDYQKPELNLPAHVAALGMRFYNGTQFPSEYRKQIFIAEHGSWNRSTPIGYRVSLVQFGPDEKPNRYSVFAEGWLQGSTPWGRPVDVLMNNDDSLLVSDDLAGAIYQISYKTRPAKKK